ncbi:hypothetical protein ABFS82_13G122100 [Erythranthe guttata]|uniref:uncharacterized protein LOC105968993 n=1 Tax=Erythranthe guttata TaxID=4155 RepID=UPI00064D8B37|nr:PREDICTED: uncharacterized protein LOC105968993 [Erythranthe guttata]|eukprot:XP_012849162.1 PREDICTED: uncharacterized protein LOC105968993 [Erythranthe guttata]
MRRSVKICCIVTLIVVVTVFAVILTLALTILKPKQPKITTEQVNLENFNIIFNPFSLNFTLGLVVNVNNPNYGSFQYDNTTAYVTYRDTPAAEAPIEEDTIPARGELDVSTTVLVVVNNLISNPGFPADILAGCLNFTSLTTFHGEAKVLRLLKIKATVHSTCYISVYLQSQTSSFVCASELKY